MHKILGLSLAVVLTAGVAATASAQEGRGRDNGWHDRDIHRFHERDIEVWHGGRWFQGRHDGRPGWWWIVGNAWYYYPQPVYPYPDPYLPPVALAPPPPAPAPGPTYYYCPRPAGYYPYVQSCRVPWRAVPAG
jgi:hypothetical protein